MSARLECGKSCDRIYLVTFLRLADAFRKKGNNVHSVALLRNCLDVAQRYHHHRAHSLEIATVLQALSDSLLSIGQISDAKCFFLQSMELWSQLHLSRKTNGLRLLTNNPHDKIKFLVRCCTVHSRFCEDRRSIAYANVLHERGCRERDLETAETCLRQALEMKEHFTTDLDHQSISATLYRLVRVFEKKSQLEEAGNLYRSCLDTEKRRFGQNVDHSEMALSCKSLANISLIRNNLSEAASFYQMSYKMKCRSEGPSGSNNMVSIAFWRLEMRL